MSWSSGLPWVLIVGIVILGIIVMTIISANASVAAEKAKSENGEQYRLMAADYEKLAQEARDNVKTIRSDLATLREKVDSIERMMREVG